MSYGVSGSSVTSVMVWKYSFIRMCHVEKASLVCGGARLDLWFETVLLLSLPSLLPHALCREDDLVTFLRSCVQALPQGSGFIVVKENIALDGDDVFDDNDSSVTR